MPAFIVAEAGVNYDGSRAKMMLLCQAAKDAGADAIKFQAYNTYELIERRKITDGHTRALLRKNELSDEDFREIDGFCKSIQLPWFASVFDLTQPGRVTKLGACRLKIGHGESRWQELIDACIHQREAVWVSDTENCWRSAGGLKGGFVHGVLCTKEYPAKSPPHLGKVGYARSYCGFSSHYADYRVPAAAALRGAEYIEAHIKLDDNCFEAPWSLSPSDFTTMVKLARDFESWL